LFSDYELQTSPFISSAFVTATSITADVHRGISMLSLAMFDALFTAI
jgi:hypothetical protein